MTHRLGSLLTAHDLPVAELCCARLDGDIVAVGDGWCSVDEPDGPALRAAAAGLLVPRRAIAERRTAAWIFGLASEPNRHQFCVDASARVHRAISPRYDLREVRCPAADTVVLGGMRVTTPRRTAVDLAREPPHHDEPALRHLIARLLSYGGVQPGDVERELGAHARGARPNLARRRVADAEAPEETARGP